MTNHNLAELTDEEDYDCPYREAIGSLLYLATNTRPDILHAVTLLAKFCNHPREKHWNAIERVLRYISGTTGKGLLYTKQDHLSIEAFTDADWASDATTRKSITGTLIKLAGGPVIFRSNQQGLVSQSTTEAEFIAAAETVRDLVWLEFLLRDLGISHNPPMLKCDPQTAIKSINNPEFPRRTKHIDVKYHFIRDHSNKKGFELKYVQSADQIADYLTKEQFNKLLTLSNIVTIADYVCSERGGVLESRSSRAELESSGIA